MGLPAYILLFRHRLHLGPLPSIQFMYFAFCKAVTNIIFSKMIVAWSPPSAISAASYSWQEGRSRGRRCCLSRWVEVELCKRLDVKSPPLTWIEWHSDCGGRENRESCLPVRSVIYKALQTARQACLFVCVGAVLFVCIVFLKSVCLSMPFQWISCGNSHLCVLSVQSLILC